MHVWLCLLLISGFSLFSAQEEALRFEGLSRVQKYDKLRRAIKGCLIEKVLDLSLVDAAYTDPEIFGLACEVSNLEIVTLLLELNVSANQPSTNRCCGRHGFYPIHRAALAGKTDIVQVLHRRGISYDQKTKGGLTLLSLAASNGHEDLAKMLYARMLLGGFNYSFATKVDFVHSIAVSGKISLMQWYLTTTNASVCLRDKFGNLPVFKAAFWGELPMVRFLLEQRPRHLQTVNREGWDLMAAAAKNNRVEVVEYLRDRGLTLAKKDVRKRQTAVHRAAADCYGNLVREGIERDRFKPKSRDIFGWDLTHHASRNGCLQVLKMLHEQYGLSLDRKTHSSIKLRPVHIAATHGHVHILDYFAEKGIDLFVKDHNGMTALDHAKKFEKVESIYYLQRHPTERHRHVSSVGSIKELWRRRKQR